MRSRLPLFLSVLALVSACAPSQKYVFYQYTPLEGVKSKSLDRLKWENEVQPGDDMSKALILQMDNASTHLVQIKGAEKNHIHQYHDSTVFIQSGTGRMYLGKTSFQVGPGAIIFIPQGLEHHYVNGGAEPTSAIAVYSPSFDGKDIIYK